MRTVILCLTICSVLLNSLATAVEPQMRQVDERRAGEVGIRKIVARHLRLYTDVPASNAVDELPLVFDQAVEQWAKYFGIKPQKVARWQMQGFLMRDREKFAALKLMPETRTDFVNGYAQGNELWMDEQPSPYYRRHLLLHEGTHGFMYAFLGGAGPGWYMEGMAELLGTHQWVKADLKLGWMPTSREEVPMWGRIKLVRDRVRVGEGLSMGDVMAFNAREVMSTEQYSWCWALCKFLDTHLQLQERFRELPKIADDPKFDLRFRRLYARDWEDLEFEWDAFLEALDYGYDTRRMTTSHLPAELVEQTEKIKIAADRGWQSSGWKLQAGKSYEVTAKGRYQIAKRSEPWPCEPGGVTIEYHEGWPLGMLIGVLRSEGKRQFHEPVAIGLQTVLKPEKDAVLYLRVNDSAARLFDNLGSLEVSIQRE